MKLKYRRCCAVALCSSILATCTLVGTELRDVRQSVQSRTFAQEPLVSPEVLCSCDLAAHQYPTKQVVIIYTPVVQPADEVKKPISTPIPTATPTPTKAPTPTPLPEPEYKIYNIDLDDDLQAFTHQMCKEYEIEEHYELILAQMWLESNFDEDLISETNDYGLMQINKCNHKELRETLSITNFLDPYQNVRCGVYLMSQYLKKYDNEHEALMCYNMGENGAKKNWAVGRYSTNYSRNIMGKKDYLLNN